MKRSEILKTAPIGLLAACGGLSTNGSGLLTPASSRRVAPLSGSGSCQVTTGQTGRTGGWVYAHETCGSGAWKWAGFEFSDKFHTVEPAVKVRWCEHAESQCNYPNQVTIYAPEAGLNDWKWDKHELQKIWKSWGFYNDGNGGGKLYNGDVSSENLVAEMHIDTVEEYGAYHAYMTLYSGSEKPLGKTYTIPFNPYQYQGSSLRLRPLASCLVDDIAYAAAIATFAGCVLSGVGALLSIGAFLAVVAANIQGRQDGCF
jgi:hypothetical protein